MPAGACGMNGSGDHLFAGPTFSDYEDRIGGPSCCLDDLIDLLYLGGFADHCALQDPDVLCVNGGLHQHFLLRRSGFA